MHHYMYMYSVLTADSSFKLVFAHISNYSYKDRLISLHLLPLSMWFEYLDITFLLKCLQSPSDHFNIFDFIDFISNSTRSSSNSKLKCLLPQSPNNHINFLYFRRVVRLWNALPVIDLTQSISTTKRKLKSFFWQHFIRNFDSSLPCTWFYSCPCSHCMSTTSLTNLSSLSDFDSFITTYL